MAPGHHPDFKKVQDSRPDWEANSTFRFTKTANPDWKLGDGPNQIEPPSVSHSKKHVSIDPHEEGRPAGFNYKLLISAIVPRPIAFISTLSPDGKTNLAPFSFFNFVNMDPPMFVVGFSSNFKDTLQIVRETKECVINTFSEPFLEAANAAAVEAPFNISEWDISGLTPVYDTELVKAPRVKESIFSIEATLHSLQEFDSKAKPGEKSGVLAVFEGVKFWAREDALNEDRNMIDPAVLKPVSRLGGISYARVTEALEIPRVKWDEDVGGEEGYQKLKNKNTN